LAVGALQLATRLDPRRLNHGIKPSWPPRCDLGHPTTFLLEEWPGISIPCLRRSSAPQRRPGRPERSDHDPQHSLQERSKRRVPDCLLFRYSVFCPGVGQIVGTIVGTNPPSLKRQFPFQQSELGMDMSCAEFFDCSVFPRKMSEAEWNPRLVGIAVL
jgi:hypothetical protein